jgi:UDP-glucuronate 4-epimerase
MMRALITGGAGFIGSHLVDSLLLDGWNVVVVDNFASFYDIKIKETNIKSHLEHKNYKLVRADIRDFDTLKSELSGEYDVIVHLAAKAGVRPSIQDPMAYQTVNVQGTQNLLELAKIWDIKQFVFASSSSVYGVNPNVPWQESDNVLMPISPYAATKVSGEMLGHVYSSLYGIRFIGLRFFTVYGPRQRPDLAIYKFSRLITENKTIPIYGDGGTRRDYTFIADIIQGIRSAMKYNSSQYEIINLGNSQTLTLKELVESLQNTFNIKAELTYLPIQPGDVPQTYADIDKAKNLLGYNPTTNIREGLEKFAKWFNEWRL